MYRRLILASLALIMLSVPARADNVITSGSVTLTPFNPITHMSFSGSGFSVSATGDGFGGGGFFPCMFGCSAGANLTFSAFTGAWGPTDLSGSMSINGMPFTFVSQFAPTTLPQLSGTGSISFAGGSVVVPFSDDPFVTLSASFSVTSGNLGGTAINGVVGLNFSGSGIGTLTLRNLGNNQYIATGITYSFQPEPVPEPATLILLTSGLVGVAVRYRKRKH